MVKFHRCARIVLDCPRLTDSVGARAHSSRTLPTYLAFRKLNIGPSGLFLHGNGLVLRRRGILKSAAFSEAVISKPGIFQWIPVGAFFTALKGEVLFSLGSILLFL